MQSAMSYKVIFQTDNIRGKVVVKLTVAESERMIVDKVYKNALGEHQAIVSVMDKAISNTGPFLKKCIF